MDIATLTCALIIGGWSYHADRSYDYNENHRALGVQCSGISAMAFTNSYGQESYGAGYEHIFRDYGRFQFGAYGGIWTGYDDYPDGMPVGGLRMRVTEGRFSAVVTTAIEVTTLHVEVAF